MTTSELKRKVRVKRMVSYGHFEIEITYRGKKYYCITTNTLAIDCIDSSHHFSFGQYYTAKQALQSLYDECKKKNNLNNSIIFNQLSLSL